MLCILHLKGLRTSVLVGAVGTSLGMWLKVAGCWHGRDFFWVTLLGQAVVSGSTNFVINAPARFAAVWFPDNEVSMALGAALFGQMIGSPRQAGFSLGSALAPLTARSSWSTDDIFWGFLQLNLSLAVLATLLLVLVIWREYCIPTALASGWRATAAPGRATPHRTAPGWAVPTFNLRTLSLSASAQRIASVVTRKNMGLVFQDEPPLPPSPARASALAAKASADKSSSAQSLASDQPLTPSATSSFLASMRRICSNVHFLLLLTSYTLLVAVFVAITTLLNRFVLEFFPDRGADAGWLATLMTLTGMLGIAVVSAALDKTKWFKELCVAVYAGSLATCVMYTVVLSRSSIGMVYWAAAGMGMFMSSFFVAGLEMAAELTYPEPEGNPTSIVNWMFQPFSLITTLVYARLFSDFGADAANYFLCGLLALGLVTTMATPKKYLRLHAEGVLRDSEAKVKANEAQAKANEAQVKASPAAPSPA
ncbi:Feline leukemia virus subgroup C receptor-related protein 2 [Frankliniella fusca]|uniref:Feline leukemia virus subgroup C receptor-related protein 2 n=1 Tax=Frankliniella fusca TaxID=407009 RepID=A0AAE1H7K1_9NEOP|nr:Feline leukemia virus subgroup C receptor-related protein 2 [Frankliniella fusca]